MFRKGASERVKSLLFLYDKPPLKSCGQSETMSCRRVLGLGGHSTHVDGDDDDDDAL
jgi:hypothetical protein